MGSVRYLVAAAVSGVVLAACGVDVGEPGEAKGSGQTTAATRVPPKEFDAGAFLLPLDAFPEGYEFDPDGGRPTDREVCNGVRSSAEWIDEAGILVEHESGDMVIAQTAYVFATRDAARYVDEWLTLHERCEEQWELEFTAEPIAALGDEAYRTALTPEGVTDGGEFQVVVVRQGDVVWNMVTLVASDGSSPLTDDLLEAAAAHVASRL